MILPKRLEWRGALLASIVIVICTLTGGKASGLAAFFGALLMLISLFFWRYALQQLTSGSKNSKILTFFLLFFKLGLMTWIIWYLIVKISIEPLAFLFGLSSIVASLFLEALRV